MTGQSSKKTGEFFELALKEKRPGRYKLRPFVWLRIQKDGAASYLLVKQGRTGPTGELTIGAAKAMSPKAAIEIGERLLDRLALGEDIFAERRAMRKQGVLLGEVFDAVYKINEPSWKNDVHRKQWKKTYETDLKAMRSKVAARVTIDEVEAALKPMFEATPETAERTRMRLERAFSYAISKGYRTAVNPATKAVLRDRLGKRKKLTRGHHKSMDYKALPAFMGQLAEAEGLAAKALELTILTGCRTSEILLMLWSEIDFLEKLWIIPAERMKGGKQHEVALSPQAIALLESLPRILPEGANDGFVFPGQKEARPMSNMSMAKVLQRLKADVTVHGFRSSLRQWAGARGFPREIAEEVLSHEVGNKVERAYKRQALIERRRELLEAWAVFICIRECAPSNVIELRAEA